MIYDAWYIWISKIAYVLLGVLTASVAGTLSYFIWLFFEKRTAKFHVKVAMQFLRMVLACFLIPIFPFVFYIFVKGPDLGIGIILISTPMGILLSFIVPICLFALVGITMHKYLNYRKKLYLCRDNIPVEDERYHAIMKKWCEKLGIRKKVQLSFNENIKSPAILYYKGYQIVMPTYIENEREFNMAVLHELVHLKHGDLTTKQIGAIANILHAFNPVIYRLRRDIEKWTEVDCDKTTCEIGKEEFTRKEYFDCLMDLKERSQKEFNMKEMCGLVENQDLINARVDAMLELKRDEMKTPLTGYLLTWFFLVFLTVGSFLISNRVYMSWLVLFAQWQSQVETLDTPLPEISSMEIFTDSELVYSDQNILNQEDSLDFTIGPGETWIFDISKNNINTVLIGVMSENGHFLAGCIGKNDQVVSIEFTKDLTDRLTMNNGNIQHIFIQNLGSDPVNIELSAAKK